MIRTLVLCLLLLPAPGLADSVADQAMAASANLQTAIDDLDAATNAKDRVAALTRTIRAYEQGMAALREAMRQAELRDTTLTLAFQSKRDEVAQLVGVLGSLDADPGPLLLLHPAGPLGTVRSGMMLADVTPALQVQAEALRAELQELADLRAVQQGVAATLADGLQKAQVARTVLSQAISERTTLPKRFTEDPAVLQNLLTTADSLEAFASGLNPDDAAPAGFAQAKGTLPFPVLGRLLLRPGETDAQGVPHPGLTLSTRPLALVTSPWTATIRYRGPLLDYGNVMILEPGGGYLIILSGLDKVYGSIGDVIAAGAPVGMMGGQVTQEDADILAPLAEDSGASDTETLYMELRQGAKPVDPTDWFASIDG